LEKALATVFNAKHWQVFSTITLLAILELIVKDVSAIAGAILDILSKLMLYGWILLFGYGFSRMQRHPESIGFWIFLGTVIQLEFVTCLLKLLNPEVVMAIYKKTASIIIVAVLSLVTSGIVGPYRARTLRLLETERDINNNDYFGDIFLFLFWPIGIWNIQPRINKLFETNEAR
jgi:hypothetical protein